MDLDDHSAKWVMEGGVGAASVPSDSVVSSLQQDVGIEKE